MMAKKGILKEKRFHFSERQKLEGAKYPRGSRVSFLILQLKPAMTGYGLSVGSCATNSKSSASKKDNKTQKESTIYENHRAIQKPRR